MNRWHSLPAEVYALVERTPNSVLLESARQASTKSAPESAESRFSRLFLHPQRVLQAHAAVEIPAIFAAIENTVAAGQFAAGFFSYECGNCFEPKAHQRPSQTTPLAWFGIYDRCFLFDHSTGAFVDAPPPELVSICESACESAASHPMFTSEFDLTERQYAERIHAIHEWIRSGHIYQLNFTASLQIHTSDSAAAIYRELHHRQPAPYSAFLHWQPERHILSLSPELFFRIDNSGETRQIVTRPMKGTAPRGRTTSEDRAQAEWLANDAKNLSENVMIVDLLRNDLGRLCHFGSVRAENLFAVEQYPTLWQMTSTVAGKLRPEINFQQVFRALFPCGSITGAPKVRAMQLIAAIEPEPRGIYTGSIGFFSQGETVFNVAIRTLALDGPHGRMGIGSGIVIDSNADDEFHECLLKAQFLTQAMDTQPAPFALIETLLWHDYYPLIELHLDRLQDSAYYFAIECNRAEVRAKLLTLAAEFADSAPRKVRLLLDCNGCLQLSSELLPALANAGPLRLRIASHRTDSRDRMLFHKTTCRTLYSESLQDATQAGYDDLIFLNQLGEVTESTIANIFLVKDGQWYTPPIACGVLAGVQRRHILETRPNTQEKLLILEDLRQADAIYLSNAVRGLRSAVIDWREGSSL